MVHFPHFSDLPRGIVKLIGSDNRDPNPSLQLSEISALVDFGMATVEAELTAAALPFVLLEVQIN